MSGPSPTGYAGQPPAPSGQRPTGPSKGRRGGQHGGRTTSRPAIRTWIVLGVAFVGFAVAALVVATYLGAALGVQTALLALLLAALPLGVVIPTFLWLDRFESEPTRFLVLAFLWGALVASALAAVFNTGAVAVFRSTTDPGAALATTAIFVAPFVEEALKALPVLFVWLLLRAEFDGMTDGMVYGGLSAAGFAFTENIQYLGMAYTNGGQDALGATFVSRCIMSPFAHPMFTVLTGVGIGVAATTRSRVMRVLAPLGGYALAVVAHSMWNLAAMTGGSGLLVVYLLVEVPIFLAFIGLIVWARRHEGLLIGRFLRPYADAGWISAGEVSMLSSMARRREARMWARTNTGRAGLAAMREFQDIASELALLRRRMSHAAADAQAIEGERGLLDALVAKRRTFLGLPMT
jgi:RsiW-degrading membrane proteinase PrsW (M82 family)